MNFKKAIKTALVGLTLGFVIVGGAQAVEVTEEDIKAYANELSPLYLDDDVQCTIYSKMSAQGVLDSEDFKHGSDLERLHTRGALQFIHYWGDLEVEIREGNYNDYSMRMDELRDIYIGAYIQAAMNNSEAEGNFNTVSARKALVNDYFDYCLGMKYAAEKAGKESGTFNRYLALARIADNDF